MNVIHGVTNSLALKELHLEYRSWNCWPPYCCEFYVCYAYTVVNSVYEYSACTAVNFVCDCHAYTAVEYVYAYA